MWLCGIISLCVVCYRESEASSVAVITITAMEDIRVKD